MLNSAALGNCNLINGSATRVIPVVPLGATGADIASSMGATGATLFLAPCDNNGQITHFVLTTTGIPSMTLIAPNKMVRYQHFLFLNGNLYLKYKLNSRKGRWINVGVFMNANSKDVAKTISNHLI